jgi:hypothetical protein
MELDEEKTSATALLERLNKHVQRDRGRLRSQLADRLSPDSSQQALPLAGSDDHHSIPLP